MIIYCLTAACLQVVKGGTQDGSLMSIDLLLPMKPQEPSAPAQQDAEQLPDLAVDAANGMATPGQQPQQQPPQQQQQHPPPPPPPPPQTQGGKWLWLQGPAQEGVLPGGWDEQYMI